MDVMLVTVCLYWFCLAVLNLYSVDGLFCYECSSLPHPRDCGKIAECGTNEVCSVNRYITSDGLERFDSRCAAASSCSVTRRYSGFRHHTRANIFPVCSKCCGQDYCNTELCDLKSSDNSLRCLSCSDVLHPSQCRAVAECLPNQICYTQAFYIGNEKRYRLGCTEKTSCAAIGSVPGSPIHYPLVGKRDSPGSVCEFCCDSPMCNMDICKNSTGAYALIKPPIYSTCADLNSDFCVYLALKNGSNVCTNLDVRDRLCPAFCRTCSTTGNVLTQAPVGPQVTVTTPGVVTTAASTISATAAQTTQTTPPPVTSLYGIIQAVHSHHSANGCDVISVKRCHMLQCEIQICDDTEIKDLCGPYCIGNCRRNNCDDIPGLS